jgi:hypothetical protein
MKRKTFRLAVAGAGLAALAATFVLATSAAVSDPATIAAIPDIPAGDTVTLSNATFGGTGNCPADNLTYGYQLGAGAPVAVATGGTGGASAGCNPAAGATIGAVAATMSFDIYLTDNHSGCSGATYDSDGGGPGGADHSLVTEENSTTFDVSITDCDEGTQTTNTRVPANGAGNFNVTVTFNAPVYGPPTVSITNPSDGANFTLNESEIETFSCADLDGPPDSTPSCLDGNGNPSGTTLDTSTAGPHSFSVTATSSDGLSKTTNYNYTVYGPPTVSITNPLDDQTYDLNQSAPTSFSCSEGTDGPGLASCKDSNGAGSVSGDSGGGTGSLVTSSVGTSIPYTVTAQSTDGQTTSKTITYTVVYAKPANSGTPMIAGKAQQGQGLSTTGGTWTGDPAPTLTYQWLQCDTSGQICNNITGATTSGYVPSSGDVGHTIEVTVTGTNPGGALSVTSQPTAVVLIGAPANQTAPSISGIAQQNQTLTAETGTWEPAASGYAYQWWSCDNSGNNCVILTGQQSSIYVPTITDVGTTLRVVVTASNNGGSSSARSGPSPVVAQIGAPASTTAPVISGTTQQNDELSATQGNWTNSPGSYAYQWSRCDPSKGTCTPISGANASTWVLGSADLGSTLEVTVTASNGTGGTPATSTQTAVVLPAAPVNGSLPMISGTAAQGDLLSASNGGWQYSPSSFAYQWLQCDPTGAHCAPLAAHGPDYVPASTDVGDTLKVTVTATNGGGFTSATSAATAVVLAPTPAPTPTNTPTVTLPPPVLGDSTNLNPVSGTILIKLPGSNTFISLPAGTNVPIGSTVNADNGTVSITLALPNGTTETGEFYDGEFVLTQAPDGTFTPVITGGSFLGCPRAQTGKHSGRASASSSKKKPGTVVRQLWGNAHGNYTTKGRYGSASVSGTIWLVQDRCDGTYIFALKDDVYVIVYAHRHRRIHILQGQHILIPPPGG